MDYSWSPALCSHQDDVNEIRCRGHRAHLFKVVYGHDFWLPSNELWRFKNLWDENRDFQTGGCCKSARFQRLSGGWPNPYGWCGNKSNQPLRTGAYVFRRGLYIIGDTTRVQDQYGTGKWVYFTSQHNFWTFTFNNSNNAYVFNCNTGFDHEKKQYETTRR